MKYDLREFICWRISIQTDTRFLISLTIFSLLSTQAFSASEIGDVSFKAQNCMLDINTLPVYTTLPKIDQKWLDEWDKSTNSDVVLPKHDFIYVSKEDVLSHIAITYYMDIISRQGYVSVKGGIADNTDWYGSFYLNDEVVSCIKLIKADRK